MAIQNFNDDWAWRAPRGPFAAVQGDLGTPTPVRLPHDALRDAERSADAPSKGAGAYFPSGAFTYVKTFDAPQDWADRSVQLEFQGAMRDAMVFVNDEFAGNRADGYTRFFVDIKPFLRLGQPNEVRVELRIHQDSRWYSGSGLHRPVLLHVDQPVHVVGDGVRVRTLDLEPDQAVIEVTTTVTNTSAATATAHLTSTVTAADGTEVLTDAVPLTLAPRETATARQRLTLRDPQPWSVEHPHLYSLTTSTTTDGQPDSQTVTTFGLRTIQADPHKGLRINGEPVLLRGACLHHDNGPLGAAAPARAEERRIQLLKEAGFNAIRAAHNPVSVAMLDACDRHGMLVMDEAFDMWHRFKSHHDYASSFEQWWRADLAAMVAKDANHPSVIMYSIGNEIAETGTPHGARQARAMAEWIRELDPIRLVTNGVNAALAVLDELPDLLAESGGNLNDLMNDFDDPFNALASNESATRRTAESSAALDVLGLNYAEQRYAMDQELFPHRVIVGSEAFGPKIGELWPMIERNPNVIGDFTWTGWDYLGEVGIGATTYASDQAPGGLEREFPWLTAWCGDIDITGWRRPISFYREIVFGLRDEPYIAVRRPERRGEAVMSNSPWAWSDSVSGWTWPGFEESTVTVEVYADADEVALLLHSDEVARSAVGTERPKLAVLEVVYRPGELTAVAYRDGAEVGSTSMEVGVA